MTSMHTADAVSALVAVIHFGMVTDCLRRHGSCSEERAKNLEADAYSEVAFWGAGLESYWVQLALHGMSNEFSWYTVGDPYSTEAMTFGMTSPRIMPGFWTEDDCTTVEVAPDWAIPSGVYGNADPCEVRYIAYLLDLTRRALGGTMPRKVTAKRKPFLAA